MKKNSKNSLKRSRSKVDGALREQASAFKEKFGRPPGASDPLFFASDADEPRRMSIEKLDKFLLAAMQAAGTPQHIVYAYKKTGLILRDDLRATYSADKVAEYDAAIAEYFAMADKSEHSDARPSDDLTFLIPPTEIPPLRGMPLSAGDKKIVIDCLRAIDIHLEKQAITATAKVEIAAAVLTMAAGSAYRSASEQGYPEQAEARYDLFVDLVVLRARELFQRHL